MKVYVNVGGENIVMPFRKALCLSCRHCDLETWSKEKWDEKSWICPSACKSMGVCSKDLVACNLFEEREVIVDEEMSI